MQLISSSRSCTTTPLAQLSSLALLLVLTSMIGFAQKSKTISCGEFSAFQVLNEDLVKSHVLSKADLSSPLLATISARADIPVRVFVGENGSVVCARAKGSANPFLKSLAEQAALKWTFTPYIRHGVKAPFQGDIWFHVNL